MLSKKSQRLLRRLIAGALTLLAVWFLALHFGLVAYSHQICPENPYTNPPNCSTYDPGIVFLSDSARFFNVIAPIVTAIATALLAYITYSLFEASERQTSITRDMHEARRAFVYAQCIIPQWEDGADGIPIHGYRPQWANSGETQTVGMLTSVNAEFIDHPLPEGFAFDGPSNTATHAMVGPKSSITGGLARSMTSAEMALVVSGKMYLYLWGWTRYRDIFGTDHITRYCNQVRAFGDPTKVRDGVTAFNVQFLFHAQGNCTDEECGEGAQRRAG